MGQTITKQLRKEARERRNAKILELRHLPIWKIQLEVDASASSIKYVLNRAGYRIVSDKDHQRKLQSAAYKRNIDVYRESAKKGLEMAKAAKKAAREGMPPKFEEPEPKEKHTPVTNVPRFALEKARRILGQTGDINLAAQQVGMSPSRLQRQINHLR